MRMERANMVQLRQTLISRLSADELRTLGFDLGIDIDDLPGQGKQEKTIELIWYFERRNELHKLVDACKAARDDISFDFFDYTLQNWRDDQILPEYEDDITIIFERNPIYPILNFSIRNLSHSPVQITSIHITKVSATIDSHESTSYLTGPRTKLQFSLNDARVGIPIKAFGDSNIANLQTGESEAFQVTLESINLLSLIQIDVEYISAFSKGASLYFTNDIIIIHSPVDENRFEEDNGSISMIKRQYALQLLIDNESYFPSWSKKTYYECKEWKSTLLRGVAHLCLPDIEHKWPLILQRYKQDPSLAIMIASFTDLLTRQSLPPLITAYITHWIQNPANIYNAPVWDNEVFSRTIISNFSRIVQDKTSFFLQVLDNTLCLISDIDIEGDEFSIMFKSVQRLSSLGFFREFALDQIARKHKQGCVEYLIAVLQVEPNMGYRDCSRILSRLVNVKLESDSHEEMVRDYWKKWWGENGNRPDYKTLEWYSSSPRLSEALHAGTSREISNMENIIHKDEVVRICLASNLAASNIILSKLSSDVQPEIRRRVATNPSTPLDILKALSNDPIRMVKNAAILNLEKRNDV